MTELDEPESFNAFRARVVDDFHPVGEVEHFLVNRVALYMVRLRRATLLEAEFVTDKLNPSRTTTKYPEGSSMESFIKDMGETVMLEVGVPARFPESAFETLHHIQRYETAIENKFHRTLNTLERLQRMRRGDEVTPLTVVDLSVHHEQGAIGSLGNLTGNENDE